MAGPIRVLVVDDHALVREGIKSLLQGIPQIEVIGEAEDGLDAIEQARHLRPDIVLMDIGMPRMTGVEATRHIREEFPGVQVVALTIHESEEYLFQMLRAGASGYVLKKAHPSEMLAAIEAAMRQETYLTPSMTKGLVTDYLRRVGDGEEETTYRELTDREREVLKLIAEGYTNPEIGKLLHISVKTVQAHRGHIMEKLDLHRPAALVRYAIRKGLVEADS
jgi:two-component system response regulator NreC